MHSVKLEVPPTAANALPPVTVIETPLPVLTPLNNAYVPKGQLFPV